jgi:hypothetical protein
MADLFLSYAHQDIRFAEMLAQLLEANGLTVWWDRRMVAGERINDVIDEQLEKAKAVIVLWSPVSVKSDWVRGEAQTAHELTKLVPIKIADCKLPINYRGILTPEVYKTKAELGKLAQMLSDKFRTAQPFPGRATAEPSTATKIEFTANSSADFLTKLATQRVAFDAEVAKRVKENRAVERLRLSRKYPLGASWAAVRFIGLVIVMVIMGYFFFRLQYPSSYCITHPGQWTPFGTCTEYGKWKK